MLMDVYAADSAVLRARAALSNGGAHQSAHVDAARVFVHDAALRIESRANEALAATVEGDALRIALAGLRRLLKRAPINAVALRRRLADEAVAAGGYIF